MRAIVQPRYGPPESVELRDVPVPGLGEGEVLVRVRASSVNATDVEILDGMVLVRMASPLRPASRIVGSDVAGVVERVGPGVSEPKPGDEVIADLSEHGHGAFAEYVAAPATAFAPRPTNLSLEEAAAVPSAAWVAIKGVRDRRELGPSSRVLVNGAGGGMGTFAVQMAKARGAEVTGVDAGPKLEMIRSIGADHVIDYESQDVTRLGERYDLILDVQARRSVHDWRRALAPDGAYLMVGGSTGRILQGVLYGQLVSRTSDMSMGILPGWPHSRRDMEDVNALIEAGSVRPVIDRTYPLAEAAQALRYVKSGEALGKVVIRVADA
jgi:NADPH:quinone reductase-like Zn-dependent oxidoreductase